MSVTVECLRVEDRLDAYHPYTVAYRRDTAARCADFGVGDPRDPAAYARHAADHPWPGDRAALVQALREGLTSLCPPQAVLDNVDRLARPNTYAIVAGHQPGLFGGPLFLAWKLMGVIRLCEILNARDEGVHFVPVYWNGSEDHNRGEFGRVTLFDREHDLMHLALPPDGARRMAQATPAHEAAELVDELAKLLPDTEFLADLLADLRDCLHGDLGETQTQWMLHLFGEFGLVVAEPRMLRALAAPVLEKALRHGPALHARLGEDTEAMQAMGFSPPLPHHEAARTLLYRIEDGERFRIRRGEGEFHLERRDRGFPGDAIFDELRDHPDAFSPSAALRPAVQGAVLPVAAYVAGGGELAYHMQLRGLFRELDVAMPLLVPRPAGTILKSSLRRTLDKHDIDPEGLIGPGWEWDSIERQAEARTDEQAEAFAEFLDSMKSARELLETQLEVAGLDNFNELRREVDRFVQRLGGVRERYRKQDPRFGDGPRRQYFRLRKMALPGDSYQELSAWTLYFQALFGPGLIPALLREIDPLTDRHHLFFAR